MRWLMACGVVLAAASASAQVRRIAAVGVADDLSGASEAELGAHALAALIQGDARFEWVSPAVQVRDDGPLREAKTLEAKRLVGEARDALDNLAFAKAVS